MLEVGSSIYMYCEGSLFLIINLRHENLCKIMYIIEGGWKIFAGSGRGRSGSGSEDDRVSFQSSSELPLWDEDTGRFKATREACWIFEEALVRVLAADASDS